MNPRPHSRPLLQLALLMTGWLLSTAAAAQPTLRVSVLQFGTAHWELAAMREAGLDRANGFELQVQPVANLAGSHLAVSSGSADSAVADLVWVQAQHERGLDYRYLPFSSSIGDIVVPANSSVQSVADLAGLRLGVAGGPDSKGWMLLNAVAERQGLDLAGSARIQYAAPPLLSEALRRGQLDAVVTYWHFAARLRADGRFRSAFAMRDLLTALDLDADLPVLGYVFRDDWAQAHPDRLAGFAKALEQTQRHLAAGPDVWQPLRPMMRVDDDATFALLRDGFLNGTPAPLTGARVNDLRRLLTLLGTGEAALMPARLFYAPPS
ncbi:ABC transporter substrate-binding protein [Marinobacter halodurans]|uniref:ABC transporter substrate-binding protein n=1 Tax=Marinobacter halodurans TaxID=2528979 RepID=A0ABY1ZQY4_9GAMM|nr:ABC transporter substrate-binding protein [Marinobacter halodurans]TBW58452.1 ABC transporter substrate-binding protein [Marinobacter halodurans]